MAAVFDFAKGAAAFPLCSLVCRFTTNPYYLIPLAAIVVGHRFPVLFRFRGGIPAAPLAGILAYSVFANVCQGEMIWHVAVVAILSGAALFVSSRTVALPGALVAALLCVTSATALQPIPAISSLILFGISADRVRRDSLLNLPKGNDVRIWRIAARPFALLFIAIDVIWNRRVTLLVMGALSIIFVVMDLVRFFSKRTLKAIFKAKESNRLSSMTLFLVATFLSFLVFAEGIPYVALTCITIGDFFGKIVGMQYGRIRLFRNKTLEGTLAFFSGSTVVTYFVALVFGIPVFWVIAGSAVAALTELFSDRFDDNFTVSIVSGGFLTAIRYFSG